MKKNHTREVSNKHLKSSLVWFFSLTHYDHITVKYKKALTCDTLPIIIRYIHFPAQKVSRYAMFSFPFSSDTSASPPQTMGIMGGRWPRSTSMMTGTPNSFSGSHTAAY